MSQGFGLIDSVQIKSNKENLTMETKKQDNKQAKTQLVAHLPIVSLTEKDMSAVSGGRSSWR